MKIEIDINDVDIFEEYTRTDGHRDWGKNITAWLYPGWIVCIIDGESAKKIKQAIELRGQIERGLADEQSEQTTTEEDSGSPPASGENPSQPE